MFMGKYCRIICRIDIIYFKYLRLNSPNILPHSVPGLWVHLVSALGPGAGVGVAAIRGAGVRAWLTRAGRYLSATGGRGGSLNSDRCGGGGCDPALGEIAGDKWAVRPIGSVRLDWRPGSWLGPWGRAVLRGGGWGCLRFALRVGAMRRFGRVKTGLAEDAIALVATLWILGNPQSR